MFELRAGDHVVQLTDVPRDPHERVGGPLRFAREYRFGSGPRSSAVGVRCGGGSVVLSAPGLRGGVDERSGVLVGDQLVVACGSCVFAVALPELALRWSMEVDVAACFGVHVGAHGRCLITHGELEIRRLTLDGSVAWSASAKDAWTGGFEVREDHVHAVDFDGDAFVIDLETGEVTTCDGRTSG